MKVKLTEMELIILLGLVAKTSSKDKSMFLEGSRTIKKTTNFLLKK